MLFKKGDVGAAEKDLAALETRRAQLEQRARDATAALEAATQRRRALPVETDADDSGERLAQGDYR